MSESKQTGLIDVVNAYFNMRTAEEAEKANAQLASISDSIQREEIVAHRRRNAIQYILSTNELLGRIHAQGITTAKDWFSLLFAQQEAVIYGTVKLDNLQDAQALQEARQLANDYWVWAGETNQQHLGVLMSISKKAVPRGFQWLT